ncbi:kinase-like protein, partial [Neolentinus lepideus HHB14362 ss-1]
PGLVMPFCARGNLDMFLKAHPEEDKLSLVCQVINGLSYLHDKNVVHGDVKPANILVNDEGRACLSDFGISRILDSEGIVTPCRPTIHYMAIEFTNSEENVGPTKYSDIWAFGMTVLALLSGRPPFANIANDVAVIISISRGWHPSRPPEIDEAIWNSAGSATQCDDYRLVICAHFSFLTLSIRVATQTTEKQRTYYPRSQARARRWRIQQILIRYRMQT